MTKMGGKTYSKKKKKNLMGFIYRLDGVLWILKALWVVLFEPINILRNLWKNNNTIFGMPRDFYRRIMYIARSKWYFIAYPHTAL